MDEDRRLLLGQVGQPGLVDGQFLVTDRPGGPLGLLVDLAADVLRRVGDGVVVGAAKQSRLVDGEAHEGARVRLLGPGQREDAERPPLVVGGDLHIGAARSGERRRLLGIFLGGASPLPLNVDAVILIADVRAVVVGHGSRAIAAPAGQIAPCEARKHAGPHAPAEATPPCTRPPGAEVGAVPAPAAIPATAIEVAADCVAPGGERVDRVGPHGGTSSDSADQTSIGDPLEVGPREVALARKTAVHPRGPDPANAGITGPIEPSPIVKATAAVKASTSVKPPALVEAATSTVEAATSTVEAATSAESAAAPRAAESAATVSAAATVGECEGRRALGRDYRDGEERAKQQACRDGSK